MRLDLFLKPVSLLTPILLAVALYLLIQQPRQEGEDRSQCLSEMRFVERLKLELSEPATQAVLKYPFACDAARDLFLGKIGLTELRSEIESISNDIRALTVAAKQASTSQFELRSGETISTDDLVTIVETLGVELSQVDNARVAIEAELSEAKKRRDSVSVGFAPDPRGETSYQRFNRQFRHLERSLETVFVSMKRIREHIDELTALVSNTGLTPRFPCEQNPEIEGCH